MDVEHEIRAFDHHRLTVCDDPYPVFAELRRRPPFFAETHGGFWVFSRYRDIFEIAQDDVRFSSSGGVTIPPVPEVMRTIPIEIDPPEFHDFRKFMNPSFALKRVAEGEVRLREDVHRLVDAFIRDGEVEIMEALAMPIPAMGICRIVGIPSEAWRQWWDLTSPHRPEANTPGRDDMAIMGPAMAALQGVAERIEARKSAPEPDFLTRLARERLPSGRAIELGEALKMTLLVFLGGFGTTTATIGSALHFLGTHPERQEELRRRPELLPTAVEEFLRYFTPVIGLARTVATDANVGGVTLRKGERLYVLWASANRDEEEFESPDELRFDRQPNRHMTFGVGAHRCIGMHIARMQIRVALEILLERIHDFRAVAETRPPTSPSGVRGFDTLTLRFT